MSIEGPPHILSNDVSDIYRVINSDIQYRKSHKESGKKIELEVQEPTPLVTIETNNLEKNKKEYMKKIETKNTKNKFQKDLKELQFEEELEKDGDMQKMKDHVKKLQAIRVEKETSGVDSQKEVNKKGKSKGVISEEKVVNVENVKINLETLGVKKKDQNNTRPLSIENDFIPELINDSKQSQRHAKILQTPPPIISKNASTNVIPTPSQSNNKFTTEFSNNSNTDYEKRNNGSFYDKSQENNSREEEEKEDQLERARQIAQAKGEFYTEDSSKKKLFTHGATSSRR